MTKTNPARRGSVLLLHASLHLLATVVVAFLYGIAIADMHIIQTFLTVDGGQLVSANLSAIGFHLVISALLWAVCVLSYQFLRAPERGIKRVRLATSRGTAMVEMLIITVPFLLMTGGLAQLSVNNIAGVASHVAAYQAGRAYWIWEKESDPNNQRPTAYKVSSTEIQELSKLAAAAALAPVAPSTHALAPQRETDSLKALRSVMYAHFSQNTAVQPGSSQVTMSENVVQGGRAIDGGKGLNFAVAFDSDGFKNRAARKLTFAYEATDIDFVNTNNTVGVRLQYKHFQVFPWFGWIFGEQGSVAGRQGYYSTYERTYMLASQVRVQ